MIPSAPCSKTEPLIGRARLEALLGGISPPSSKVARAGAAHGVRGGKGDFLVFAFPEKGGDLFQAASQTKQTGK